MQFVEENKESLHIGLPLDRLRVDELDQPVRRRNGGMREMMLNAFGIRFRDGHDGEYSSYSDGDDIDAEDNDEYEDLLELDEDVVDPVPEELLRQLPASEFTAANLENFSEENKSCSICQCNYEVKEKYIILPCLHRFHSECVSTWFERKSTCPICKRRVGQDEEELN